MVQSIIAQFLTKLNSGRYELINQTVAQLSEHSITLKTRERPLLVWARIQGVLQNNVLIFTK